MKLLVISDSHRYLGYAENVIKRIGDKMEAILHLGDYDSDAKSLMPKFTDKKFYFVKGNNEISSSDTPFEEMIVFNGKKVLLTHGHRQQVHWNYDSLGYWADEKGADIVLFGHTHAPYLGYSGRVIVFNPGSISLPRTTDNPTFGVIDISDSGIIEASVMEYVSKNEFKKII